jgi:glyoxalase family protein
MHSIAHNLSGIHHITAIASSAAENVAFYSNTLGLRLIKKTVNFDDPHTYHLYFGDHFGTPGTILTFFPWENIPKGRPGAGMITAIAFAVPLSALDFWRKRLADACDSRMEERFGDPVLHFSDPHGLPLELVGLSSPPATSGRQTGPIAPAHAIVGFHSATAKQNDLSATRTLLMDTMGLKLVDQTRNRYRFAMSDTQAPGHYLDMIVDPSAPAGRQGGGTVHHIAFRTQNDAAQRDWQSRLRKTGLSVTDVRDRHYFRSIYFHAPLQLLFEIATDGPGFTVDEAEKDLGKSLKLPPHYESMRPELEKRLDPLTV